MVTLKDFVRETLKQLSEAGAEAGDDLGKRGMQIPAAFLAPSASSKTLGSMFDGRMNSQVFPVEFDVAITTEDSDSGTAGGGVRIGIVRAGGDLSSSSSTTNASRVKFTVPIVYPSSRG